MDGINFVSVQKPTNSQQGDKQTDESMETISRKFSMRKIIVISIVAVTIALICVASVMAVIYLKHTQSHEALQTILSFNSNGIQETERVHIEEGERLVYLELVQQDASLIMDYGKRIMFGKKNTGSELRCFAKPFDGRQPDLEELKQALLAGNTTVQTYAMTLGPDAITDRGFLPNSVLDLCKEYPIHWVIAADSSGLTRFRRWEISITITIKF